MTDNAYATLPPAVKDFRPRCPGCSPTKVTAAEARPCSFYACPGLPDELRVTCDLCMYDFAARDGQMKCDHSTCEKALWLESHVLTYELWLDMLRSEMEQSV